MDWIADFEAYLEPIRTNSLFKRWVAVYTLGAALQRRVWLPSEGRRVYPNLYIILCGESAAGKGEALNPVPEILGAIDKHFIAPSSMTGAALVDELRDATVEIFNPHGESMSCNPVTIVSAELGVLLPEYSNIIIQRFTDLYDNKGYSERTRGGKEKIELPNAHLSIIAGTTPSYMAKLLPEGAWHEGFMSRVITVYGQPEPKRPLNPYGRNGHETDRADLIFDLDKLLAWQGKMEWDPLALAAFNQWYFVEDAQPAPKHPKLMTYLNRRHYNLLKIMMIYARGRDSQFVEEQDFDRALTLLQDTELHMEDIFKAINTGGAEEVMKDLWYHLMKLFAKTQEPIRYSVLAQFLSSRVPAHHISFMIKAMVDSGFLKEHQLNKIGPAFQPLNPSDH